MIATRELRVAIDPRVTMRAVRRTDERDTPPPVASRGYMTDTLPPPVGPQEAGRQWRAGVMLPLIRLSTDELTDAFRERFFLTAPTDGTGKRKVDGELASTRL